MEASLTAEAESIQRTLEFPINVQFITGESKLLTFRSLCPLEEVSWACTCIFLAHVQPPMITKEFGHALLPLLVCLESTNSTPEVYLNHFVLMPEVFPYGQIEP